MLDKEWFIDKINSFLREDYSNRMTGVDGILIWEPDVIVGFCSGDDPIFEYYKKVVGPFHLTPAEAYSKHFSVEIDSPENLTVVAFILPTNEITKKKIMSIVQNGLEKDGAILDFMENNQIKNYKDTY